MFSLVTPGSVVDAEDGEAEGLGEAAADALAVGAADALGEAVADALGEAAADALPEAAADALGETAPDAEPLAAAEGLAAAEAFALGDASGVAAGGLVLRAPLAITAVSRNAAIAPMIAPRSQLARCARNPATKTEATGGGARKYCPSSTPMVFAPPWTRSSAAAAPVMASGIRKARDRNRTGSARRSPRTSAGRNARRNAEVIPGRGSDAA